MNADRTPDPEFVNRLEWQIESAWRRRESVAPTARAGRLLKSRLGTSLVLAVAAMFVGGAGTYVATHRVDEEAVALYIARGEALVEIARTQLDHWAQELTRARDLLNLGLAGEPDVQQVEAMFVQAQADVQTRELELTETRTTGANPNDALAAPLVRGRDFVSERLAARRHPLQMRLAVLMTHEQRSGQLFDNGLVSEEVIKNAQVQVAAAGQELAGLEHHLTLRASFLAGELSATEVELQSMRFAARAARESAARQAEVVAEQYQRLRQLAENALVSDPELRRVEAQLRTARAQVELADLELRILEQKLETATKE
ncbi:MAG TPA: hypothetical protein PKK06_15785 [Phycisphaerae bacterium]|nr:hypothetical protein [Phycisphaerae bacterium]HNU47022.1 hypothetical protein [Phycisphaerae bacterium]